MTSSSTNKVNQHAEKKSTTVATVATINTNIITAPKNNDL